MLTKTPRTDGFGGQRTVRWTGRARLFAQGEVFKHECTGKLFGTGQSCSFKRGVRPTRVFVRRGSTVYISFNSRPPLNNVQNCATLQTLHCISFGNTHGGSNRIQPNILYLFVLFVLFHFLLVNPACILWATGPSPWSADEMQTDVS